MKMKMLVLVLSLVLMAAQAHALRITDSSTSDKGARSTYSSLTKTNTSSTYGYQNSYGVSVGMVVAFTSQKDIATPDRIKWLECNGQTFDRNQYPELYEALGVNRVPNLNGQFMRGTTDTSAVLSYREDTIKSHDITVEPHTHVFNNGESSVSGSINGIAAGQRFSASANLPVSGSVTGNILSTGGSTITLYGGVLRLGFAFGNKSIEVHEVTWKDSFSGHEERQISIPTSSSSSSTTLALNNGKATGTISGTANSSSVTGTISGSGGGGGSVEETGELTGTYEGAEETAPKHTYVRYFIRAIP